MVRSDVCRRLLGTLLLTLPACYGGSFDSEVDGIDAAASAVDAAPPVTDSGMPSNAPPVPLDAAPPLVDSAAPRDVLSVPLDTGPLSTDAGTPADGSLVPRDSGPAPSDAQVPTSQLRSIMVPVHAVRVADDDGSREARVTAEEVAAWLEVANRVYAVAGVQFVFNPALDFSSLRSSLVNRISGIADSDWAEAKAKCDSEALRYPGRITLIFRYGRAANGPTGGGFSWTDYDFVALPGPADTSICGHANRTLLPQVMGYHLGLRRTFAEEFRDLAAASTRWSGAGGDRSIFDGDGLIDTDPDPMSGDQACLDTPSVTLGTDVFPVPRHNVMSFYDSTAKTLTPEQIAIVRQVALLRQGKSVVDLTGASLVREGEQLVTTASGPGVLLAQTNMRSFHGRWSGDAQLFWRAAAENDVLSVPLPAPTEGTYRVWATLTKGPDFGVHRLAINGTQAAQLDLYSRTVHHTGPVDLGVHRLGSASRVTLTAGAKNSRSTSYAAGIDYFLLLPE